jgi:hypothetical protein
LVWVNACIPSISIVDSNPKVNFRHRSMLEDTKIGENILAPRQHTAPRLCDSVAEFKAQIFIRSTILHSWKHKTIPKPSSGFSGHWP